MEGEDLAKPASTGPISLVMNKFSVKQRAVITKKEKDIAGLEHLRLGTIVSSDQDSEESMDDKGNFIVNGQIVDLGTMEHGSVANQEIPDFILLNKEIRRPFHSR